MTKLMQNKPESLDVLGCIYVELHDVIRRKRKGNPDAAKSD